MFFKILKGAKRYWGLLVVAMFSVLAVTGLNLLAPALVRELVKVLGDNFNESEMRKVYIIGAVLAGSYVLKIFLRFFINYFSHKAAYNYLGEIRARIYEHLQTLSMGYFQDKQTGQLMSRIISDTATFEALIAHAVPDTVTNILVLVGVFVILFIINPTLTLLTCIPIPFILAAGFVFVKKVRPNFRKAQKNVGILSGTLQDNLSGLKEIQVFNQQEREAEKIGQQAQNHVNAMLKALKVSAIFHPFTEFLTSIGTVIVIICGGLLAVESKMDTADIVGFIMYLSMFYAPIMTLVRVSEEFQNAMAGAERVFEILDAQSDVKDDGKLELKDCKGVVEFKDVAFNYLPDVPVLRDINFKIDSGKMLAIVGVTGAGKTTIISTLARFYDIEKGEILIDGQNIKDVSLKSLRDNISAVLQDVFLFNGTVFENIAYAMPNSSQEEVEKAAMGARIHDDILAMPEGYGTVIGERGVRLSGGQKQRLSIARAILRNSPILILDEATASVDVETEHFIQQSIADLAGTRTIIVIAHRLSTIKKADEIIVIGGGTIQERGTHEQLIKRNGIYANLANVQISGAEDDGK